MLDWHSCQICYPLEIKILLLLLLLAMIRSVGILKNSFPNLWRFRLLQEIYVRIAANVSDSLVTFQNPDCSGYDVQYTAHTSHLDDSSVLSTPIVLISSTVMPLNTPETFNSLMSNSGNDVKPAIEETSLL